MTIAQKGVETSVASLARGGYLFKADLPGIDEQNLEINVSGNRLTVSGRREMERPDEFDTFYCSERTSGSFARSFTLPEGINADHIRADLKDGILTIHVPKTVNARPRRILIGVAGEKKATAG